MTIPVRLGLVDAESGDLPLVCADATAQELAGGVFALEGPSRALTFSGVARRPALSALRGFSAPVNVEDDLTEADHLTLLEEGQRPVQPLAVVADARGRSVEARGAENPRGRNAEDRSGLRRAPTARSSRTRSPAASTRLSRRWR